MSTKSPRTTTRLFFRSAGPFAASGIGLDLGVHGDVRRLVLGLSRRKPDLIFNMMEMFADNMFGDIAVTGTLDLLWATGTPAVARAKRYL